MAELMKNLTSFMYTRNVTDKYMVNEQCHDSLSRVIGNSQARFLEGEDTATYSSLLDKKYGQMKSMLFPQFKSNPITGWQIKLPKLGLIPVNLHRSIPDAQYSKK